MRKYIFDVDGTLTPSRSLMNTSFKKYMTAFMQSNYVYLVTGSDKPKTVEQISTELYNTAVKVYQCSGNDVWQQDNNISTNHFKIPEEAEVFLSTRLNNSAFRPKTGMHFDFRPGLLNFSILGRNASLQERAMYKLWNSKDDERHYIAREFNKLFPGYIATVAGEIGIDISPEGMDKAQIIHDFSPHDQLYFFGDAMEPGGNDYTLSLEIAQQGGNVYHVRDWRDTLHILQTMRKGQIDALDGI
jgi:phosphomannomutase